MKALTRSVVVSEDSAVSYVAERRLVPTTLEPAEQQVPYMELYNSYHARVLRLSRLLLSDPAEAEEVGQDVFLKLFNEHRSGNSGIAWEPWLMRVTVNACRDRMRSAWWKWFRSPSEEFHESDHRSYHQTPEESVVSRQESTRIWQSVQALSRRQREVFVLRYVEGHSTEEVAAILHVTQGSVKRHLFRAVCQLRKSLGDH